MRTVSKTTVAASENATTIHAFVYAPKGDTLQTGIGFAEMFSTMEYPAVAAKHSPWWMNSVPCLARLPFGVSYRQARLDRIMLRRAWRQMRKS